MSKSQIVYRRIEEIHPYEKNPRKNSEAVEYVANSIKEFGFRSPIIIDRNDVIIAGHTRLEASKKLKLKEVPCIVADDLTEDQVKALRLADNKVSEKSEWDDALLTSELFDISGLDIDMSLFGFDIDDDEAMPEVKEEVVKPFTKAFVLISSDIDHYDRIASMMKDIESIPSVEVTYVTKTD